ncbi:hypothetical protein CASFOL_017285 [Castilleja foliolosa]|uniref:Uncharacterized protein n=1 Tax=Castilleja foliolosa TaxID=1961234 RepID=A0ABD3DB70_9LAMI
MENSNSNTDGKFHRQICQWPMESTSKWPMESSDGSFVGKIYRWNHSIGKIYRRGFHRQNIFVGNSIGVHIADGKVKFTDGIFHRYQGIITINSMLSRLFYDLKKKLAHGEDFSKVNHRKVSGRGKGGKGLRDSWRFEDLFGERHSDVVTY